MSLPTSIPSGDTLAQCSELIRASDMPAKKAPSLCDGHHEIVTIIMKGQKGLPDCKYFMHKIVACHYSPVLDKAFNGPFIEGQTQTLTIEDVLCPRTFGGIQSWIYTQTTNGWGKEWGEASCSMLYDVWILADRLIIPKLQDEVMMLLMGTSIPLLPVKWIYQNTSPESKLRSSVSDRCAKTPFKNLKSKEYWLKADFPTEILLDVIFTQPGKPNSSPVKR